MIAPLSILLLATAACISACPVKRQVEELNEEAFAEAHQRDDTATRAFSNTAIKTSDGQCLTIDELSGDFRANLTPVQVAECDGSDGQSWDIITSGEHINEEGMMLIVSTLTQACLNFDPRRAAGDQVNLFSCGGRADGGGVQVESQLFAFDDDAKSVTLEPQNEAGTCLEVNGDVLDQAACATSGDDGQTFTLG